MFQKKSKEFLTTKEDIVCFKVLLMFTPLIKSANVIPGRLYGPLSILENRIQYELGKLLTERSFSISDSDTTTKGFYSYKTREIGVERCENYFKTKYYEWGFTEEKIKFGIYKSIIPAGAKYYENDTEYISNQIILTDGNT